MDQDQARALLTQIESGKFGFGESAVQRLCGALSALLGTAPAPAAKATKRAK